MKRRPSFSAYADIITLLVGDPLQEMVSFLTTEYFYYCCIFAGNKSDLTFIYYSKIINIAEALDTKKAYEYKICKYRKDIKYYNTNKGVYTCEGYKIAVYNSKYILLYYSICTYF